MVVTEKAKTFRLKVIGYFVESFLQNGVSLTIKQQVGKIEGKSEKQQKSINCITVLIDRYTLTFENEIVYIHNGLGGFYITNTASHLMQLREFLGV